MEYTIQTSVSGEFDDVIDATTAALDDEGFGVLSDIDVQGTFAEQLDEDFRQYRILGACNPSLAQDALTEEIRLGALLPCNVVVYETDAGDVEVAAVDPTRLVAIADGADLDAVAAEVRDRFERVLETVAASFDATATA